MVAEDKDLEAIDANNLATLIRLKQAAKPKHSPIPQTIKPG